MDYSVKDFNVRLRTIRLWELIAAIIIAFFLTGLTCNYFNIDSGEAGYILFFCYLMIFFIIATLGTRGFTEDIHDVFKLSNLFKVVMIVIPNIVLALFIQNYLAGFDAMFNYIGFLTIPLSDVVYEASNPLLFIFEFFIAVILAPISEELFFRGVLFNRLKIRKGVIFALIASSVFFGLCHFNYADHLAHIIYTCLFGMCLCILYLRTDNLLINMFAHAFYNFLSYLIVFTPIGDLFFGGPFTDITLVVLLFSMVFIPVYIFYFAIKLK